MEAPPVPPVALPLAVPVSTDLLLAATTSLELPLTTAASSDLSLAPASSADISSSCEQIMVRTRSLAVGTRSLAVTTAHVALATEPECLGPCEPGTSVNLEGIVWQETEDGEPSNQPPDTAPLHPSPITLTHPASRSQAYTSC